MKSYKQEGNTMEYSNSGSAISSGSVVVVGGKVCVAMQDIAATTGKGSLLTKGVVSLTKKASLAIGQGDRVYWDASPGEITKTQADGKFAGYCTKAALAADAEVELLLVDPCPQAAFVADASSGSAAEINAIRDALVQAGLMAAS